MHTPRPPLPHLRLPAVIAALLFAVGIGAVAQAQTSVRIIPAPERCLVPDVVMDARGVLHMIYALDRNAYYIRSADNGRTFTAPVQVNSEGAVENRMGERGPKLAVGGDGIVHVVWADYWQPGAQCFARYARSLDGGKTFGARQTVSAMPGVDGVTMTADGKGNVIAFWHVMAAPQPDVPAATWLHLARSTDNGATFGPSEKLKISNFSSLACTCCMLRARVAPDGSFLVGFRSAEKNIRDLWVLKGAPRGDEFTAVRVNQDNWNIDYCPMNGPELTFTPDGRVLCAVMTGHKVYWAISDPGLTAFDLHVATPANENDEIYPTAVANRRGEVLFVWQVGPMSTAGTATVKWATYSTDGKFTGQQDTVGTSFSGTRATAFVGTDDGFYIVTTAMTIGR